jgi:hypothetical protein
MQCWRWIERLKNTAKGDKTRQNKKHLILGPVMCIKKDPLEFQEGLRVL